MGASQGVVPPVRAGKKLAPDENGITVRSG